MSVVDGLEQLMHAFLWSRMGDGKRDHLTCRETLCKPNHIGSLGFDNLGF